MKQIKVDSCTHCPLLKHGVVCTHAAADGMTISNNDIIDPNCPLENLEEE